MAKSKLSQQEWVEAAFSALVEQGPSALRIEPLAKRLGVTKGSFYWHFKDRRALELAVLDEWRTQGTADIIKRVEASEPDDPAARLRRLIMTIFIGDKTRGTQFTDYVEGALRSWSAEDAEIAAAVAEVDAARIAYVAGLLRDSGLKRGLAQRRAQLLYRAMIGEFVWRSANGPASSRRELDEFADLLLDDAT